MIIVLDTFPASSVSKRTGTQLTMLDRCREWTVACETAGHTILVPAIAYYEVLRELEHRNAVSQIARLRAYCCHPSRFIPLTTDHLEIAARLWGEARRIGKPTASPEALDGDVILAAQTLSFGLPTTEYVVATTNPNHLSQFLRCDLWSNISP